MDSTFDYGEQVRVTRSIRNDGTVLGADRGDLLIRRGSVGFVKGVGKFLQDQVIYQVHFLEQGITIGCRDTEVCSVDDPWVERLFERGDKVSVQVSLASGGKTVVEANDIGTVLGVENKEEPLTYRVCFERTEGLDSNSWVVPETVLKLDKAAPMVLGRG